MGHFPFRNQILQHCNHQRALLIIINLNQNIRQRRFAQSQFHLLSGFVDAAKRSGVKPAHNMMRSHLPDKSGTGMILQCENGRFAVVGNNHLRNRRCFKLPVPDIRCCLSVNHNFAFSAEAVDSANHDRKSENDEGNQDPKRHCKPLWQKQFRS